MALKKILNELALGLQSVLINLKETVPTINFNTFKKNIIFVPVECIMYIRQNDKLLSFKGEKQIGKLVSAERGKTITLMFAMNVTGHFMPPLFIFPKKKHG